MPAPRKYPDEMRDRAIRLVADIAEDAESITARRLLLDSLAASTALASRMLLVAV